PFTKEQKTEIREGAPIARQPHISRSPISRRRSSLHGGLRSQASRPGRGPRRPPGISERQSGSGFLRLRLGGLADARTARAANRLLFPLTLGARVSSDLGRFSRSSFRLGGRSGR